MVAQARLILLGRLEDVAGTAELAVAPGLLDAILAELPADWALALRDPRVRLALNGNLLAPDATITLIAGDELAFLPPVSGG